MKKIIKQMNKREKWVTELMIVMEVRDFEVIKEQRDAEGQSTSLRYNNSDSTSTHYHSKVHKREAP